MDNEKYLDSRTEQPIYFLAPDNFIECCSGCGLAILPGEIIVQVSDFEFMHERCIENEQEN